jgi:magnesium transporter
LEDLVLHKGEERITSFVRKAELVVYPAEDQETIAKRMMHYGLMNVPVVDNENHFLGVISSETLVDVLVEEATEDVQKMSALAPIKQPYFEVPFFRLLFERSYILVALLFAESFSMTIMRMHESTLNDFLLFFIPMLISAGGNSSSQTSAVVIQGMASGELGFFNMIRFLKRELFMAALIGIILGLASFIRVYFSSAAFFESFVISISLTCIVLLSVLLGSIMPFLLKKLRIDPAFSAGPFLATIMDVLGIMIYCFIVKLLLF